MPSRLARATYGSLSWRSSQRFCETLRFFRLFSRTASGRSSRERSRGLPCAPSIHCRVRHHLHQHALAQPAIRDAQARARNTRRIASWMAQTPAPDRRARCRCRGSPHPLVVAHRAQLIEHRRHLVVDHPAAVDLAAIVALEAQMDARDGGHGAGVPRRCIRPRSMRRNVRRRSGAT